MTKRTLSPAQEAELVARLPLIFQYYAHLNSTQDAVARAYDPWQLFPSILTRPEDELSFKLAWYSRFLDHLVHDLDETARDVEESILLLPSPDACMQSANRRCMS